jgi:predicted regulator of Ras-like GTPase activity (Roadblock/LC7/MglB family)
MQQHDDLPRADPLKQALGEYLRIPGMKAAILVSDQGLMISSVAEEHVDTASIAALVIDTVATAQRFGLQVQAGFLDTMSIEFEKLTVVLAPFTPDVMLALVALPGSVGASRRASSDTTIPLRESLRADAGAPAGQTGPPREEIRPGRGAEGVG